MTPLPRVVAADYRGTYSVFVTFSDGRSGTIDFRPWLNGPVFQPLLDEAYFQKFFLANSTVTWPNGADIAPETLYQAVAIRHVA